MARVIRKEVKASDLPKEWQAGLDAAPDEVVRVTVDARSMRCSAQPEFAAPDRFGWLRND